MRKSKLFFLSGRKGILPGWLAAGAIAAYFLAPIGESITAFHPMGSEATAMTSRIKNGTVPRAAAIPPIDASLPRTTETATFALG